MQFSRFWLDLPSIQAFHLVLNTIQSLLLIKISILNIKEPKFIV
jgi:hypothetical protein